MSQNPYSPTTNPGPNPNTGDVDPQQIKKLEAIIKDANQFWLAILLCFLCSALGVVIIGPWYGIRLMQWNRFATEDPRLMSPEVPPGSLAYRFQKAKIKLIIGLAFGIAMGGLIVLTVLALSMGSAQ